MAQKLFSTERKVKGERERELSFGIKINVRGGGGGVPNLEKEEFKFQTSLGMNGKTGVPWVKTH